MRENAVGAVPSAAERPPFRGGAVTALALALASAAYLLPIWVIALYLIIANPYESGWGWLKLGLEALGLVVTPVLWIGAIVFAVIAWSRSRENRALAIASLAIVIAAAAVTVAVNVTLGS